MAKEYLRPGVFVEEVPAGAFPIEGVGTTTGAFLGIASRGALNKPQLITNWTQFQKHFGSYRRDSFLAYAVNGFFLNGGRRCYVVRVASGSAAIASATLKDREGTAPADTLLIQALNEGEWGNALTVDVADGTADPASEFKLVVKESGEVVETWDDLSMDPAKKNYALTRVNGRSNYIQLANLGSATAPPDNRPAVVAGAALAGGADGASDITDAAYIGDAAARTGLHAFDTVDDVNNLVIPGKTSTAIVQAGLDYCASRADLGYVVDPPQGQSPQDVKAFREGFDSSYGFLYYPWLTINDPLTDAPKTIPPSGYVAGIYAKSDTGQRDRPRRGGPRVPRHRWGAGGSEPRRRQRHSRLPRTRHPRLGRADHLLEPEPAVRPQAPVPDVRRGVHRRRHPVGRLRAERRAPMGQDHPLGHGVPQAAVARGRALRQDRGGGLLRQVRRGDEPAGAA
jgi:phage tail sheath protein FI